MSLSHRNQLLVKKLEEKRWAETSQSNPSYAYTDEQIQFLLDQAWRDGYKAGYANGERTEHDFPRGRSEMGQ